MQYNKSFCPIDLDLNCSGLNLKLASEEGKNYKKTTDKVAPEKRRDGLSYAEILVNFLKGMIGPGCLSLPLAFKQAGLLSGLFLIFILGFLNCICMLKLVKCAQLLSKRNNDEQPLNYGDLAFKAVSQSFIQIRPYAYIARIIVNTSIVALQIGICSVFYVFCGTHIKEFFDDLLPMISFRPSSIEWMLLLFGPFLLINIIRSLRTIAILSTIGNFLCLIALFFIFQYLIRTDHHLLTLPWINNFTGLFTATGAILYSFEGQAMVLPLENRIRYPSKMLGPFGVLSIGISVVSLVYASSGFLGYITYGEEVRGSITLNLPKSQIDFLLARLLLCLVIYFGFVIQMYVIVDLLWPPLIKMIGPNEFNNWTIYLMEISFRAVLVLITMLFAIAVPNLEQLIPLVGATTGMLLALIIPSLLDLLVRLPGQYEQQSTGIFVLLFEDLFLAGIGCFGIITGVHSNLIVILHDGKNLPNVGNFTINETFNF